MAERTDLAQPSPANRNRPPILKRTSITSTQSTNSSALLGSPRKEKIIITTTTIPESKAESMAAAFLQYCAMCEKQITHPSLSILYCSEACRRKDSKKPLSAATIVSSSPGPTAPYSPPASAPSSPRSILPPRLPTGVSEIYSKSPYSSTRIPCDDHGFKSDLDPTEWKPHIPVPTPMSMPVITRRGRPTSSRHNSEAFRYLMSFHRSINKNGENGDYEVTADGVRIEVPTSTVAGVSGSIGTGFVSTAPPTPSLGNTPTTTSSSWGAYTSTSTGTGTGGYDFATRPLMPRHNRWYSTSSAGHGVDLVTPHIPPPPESEAYAKKAVMRMEVNRQDSGLGAFFGGGASLKDQH